MSTPGSYDWDALESRVSGRDADAGSLKAVSPLATLPEYRRVWFLSLIRQGRAADAEGRTALAAHCGARVEKELTALSVAATTAVANVPAPATTQPATRATPLADLAARQGTASRARLQDLLARHAGRLSPAERAAFQSALETATEGSDKSHSSVAELRRRLVDRLLRASRYRRQAARLATWKPSPPDAAPTGPYNDRRALEEALHRAAVHNPEWAAEFFDIYAGMRAVRKLYGELLPGR